MTPEQSSEQMDDLFALQRPIKYKLGRGHCLTKLEEMDSLMFRVEKKIAASQT
jgi:hypothetical protein